MYLKSIEVNGFKSFANRILFQFNNGITGIVGPNGSGKSNVGDAVRWVLGEQSAKQLRGAKMEDVIFAGTELRKPQGSAYVAITLDNSDHSLPLDYEEVTVARRVYRSGESEYLLNGTTCRLKDVQNLFFDTGIGKEGYSIIGQGQVEKILNGKPDEKRELFDEAAGIVKYKKNKIATERELENERQNLERVNDILSELEKQVGPLKHQSEVAKKYLTLKENLKKLDINVFLLENEKTAAALKELTDKLEIVTAELSEKRAAFDETKSEYDRLDEELSECNRIIDETRIKVQDIKLTNQRTEGEINVLKQRIEGVKQSDMHLNAQIERINKELELQKKDRDDFDKKQGGVGDKLAESEKALEEAKKVCEEKNEIIEKLEAEIQKTNDDIKKYMSEGATIKEKTGRYDTMLENINFRKTQLKQRYLEYKSDEQADKEQYEDFNSKLSEIEKKATELLSKLDLCEDKLSHNQEASHANREEISRINRELSAAQSKHEALRNITERYDGYGNSIRKVMDKKADTPGIIGVVADIIEVDKKYEIAVETALGGSIQNIVTDNENTAKKMINYLKENRFGRATFLPLTNLSDRGGFVKPEALKEKGAIGLASTLVKVDSKYKAVAETLLGRILVADHIDNAIAIAKKYKHSIRIVTVEGELLNPGGSMTGGAYKNTSNLLGRKRELDELKDIINKLKREDADSQQKDMDYRNIREELKAERDKLNSELQELYLEKNTITVNIEQVSKRLSDAAASFASVKKEDKELDAQIEELNRSKNELSDSGDRQNQAIDACNEQIESYEKRLAEEKDALIRANETVSECMLNFNSMKQQEEFIAENLTRIVAEEEKLREELKGYTESVAEYKNTINELNTEIDELSKSLIKNKEIILKDEELLSKENKRKNEITTSHKDFFKKREALSEELSGLERSEYSLNSQSEKISEKLETLGEYMWEEYELTLQGVKQFRDESLTDLPGLKKEASSVKSQIKALGDVNVNAIEDYKNVSERYEFLKTQHDDIVTAENNLKGIIDQLDAEMKEQFTEKFKEIQVMFDKVFKDLFGGGKSALELVDEDDILETGIRIIAQPPGKKLQNMMQLSGGEKSLTAIALLFAIQSLKPSPFCLLDEIEAALDDSNVKRFANYLDKLTSDTQFIVITHRKGTMEAADVLYGITMQEKGVSTLVSVNLVENELDD
ncbi:MAG: chromosome segregation protein SMC [Lachnospiraceae bacterium]|nr:chromosome segregation protein SMC [Lachnospiraceae bacterium]